MLSLYNPATKTFQPASGGQQSDPLLMVNILIELRVLTSMMWDQQYQGKVTQTVDQYRLDAVNETTQQAA